MSDWLKPLLDQYDRKARLRPALLCGLPLVAAVALLIPKLGTIWGVIGRRRCLLRRVHFIDSDQPRLRQGTREAAIPVVARQSPRRQCFDTPIVGYPRRQRIVYRSFLSSAIPALTLASPQEEAANPEQADAGIR